MDIKTVQRALKTQGYYTGNIDGLTGPKLQFAIRQSLAKELPVTVAWATWSPERQLLAVKQLLMREMGIETGRIDGLMGPQTQHAVSVWHNRVRDVAGDADDAPRSGTAWPTQAQVPTFYGERGANQVMLQLPYTMRLSYELGTVIRRISCHEKVHDAMGRVLTKVLEHYGEAQLRALRLDLFGGCLNVRKMRGGTAWSMHSWGIAVDIDPDRNELHWGKDQAAFGKAEYDP